MKKYSNLIITFCSFIVLIFIFLNKEIVSSTIINSFYIWFNTLVPSMFPMIVLSNILISYRFTDYIPKFIVNFISKLFNISYNATLVVILSLVSGFPVNAVNIKTAYDQSLITKEEAEHLLLFNHFANPLFVLETVGVIYLGNNKYGIIILITLVLSNVIIGVIFRRRNTPSDKKYTTNIIDKHFTEVLSSSSKKAIDTLLMVSASVTIFLILSTLISEIFNLNIYLTTVVRSILEMTVGLSSLANTPIKDIYKVALSTCILSFGGLSIHLQVISVLDDTILYYNYFKGRIYQVIISFILSIIIFLLS